MKLEQTQKSWYTSNKHNKFWKKQNQFTMKLKQTWKSWDILNTIKQGGVEENNERRQWNDIRGDGGVEEARKER